MRSFANKLAVITGGGTGMGRELAKQLTAEGCHVAICDVSSEHMAETARQCAAAAPSGVQLSTHVCDVSDERQVIAFRDAVLGAHRSTSINLLFNNAGIGGGGSFLREPRADWEKVFGVCWFGVYYCTRAFLPLLIAGDDGYIVNTSSVNGFWACLGPEGPHTAYSSAKFAVKGFTEALMVDLRVHAPHVKAAVVMPGHIGTSIMFNSNAVLGKPPVEEMDAEQLEVVRAELIRRGLPAAEMTDDQIRSILQMLMVGFRDNAPMSAEAAARVILDGVRNDLWRILVGEDAHALDRAVRADPEAAYEPAFMAALHAQGHFRPFG